ncbi:tetratricopeptide repeat protein [Caballeronia insecticola]|uniref:Tetratricopeptide TPR_2 repeat protein n=1 Tax=Caballeronia insecticola TaxID=758793 RepID=R4WTV5_9BURK|nr:tetratricopeptide repeat protein [Caballeronia insecticola]BAN24415.1 tetratricopeptide TPR_2 repeat protein [Caballeronia insecticola]
MTVPGQHAISADQQYRLAEAHYLNNRFHEALAGVDAAWRARLASPALWNVAAASFLALGKTADAERCFREAIAMHPGFCPAHSNLGMLLSGQRRYEEAESELREALRIDPAHVETHNNLGVMFKEQDRCEKAEAAFSRALELRPDFADAALNLGMLLCDQRRFAEAAAVLRRLQERDARHSNDVDLHLGIVFREEGRLAEAEAAFRRVSATHPRHAAACAELAHLLLRAGRYAEGWTLYEYRCDARLARRSTFAPDLDLPRWQGEPLAGKSVLLPYEQGYGDMIQFSRYFPVLKALGAAHVTVACPEPLHRLMQGARAVDAVVNNAARLDARHYDVWTFPLSIPLHVGTTLGTIPSAAGVISAAEADIERWRPLLQPLSGMKIGLVWKGSATHSNDRFRSLPGLASLAPLWSIPGARFVSLQKGAGEDEAHNPPPAQPLLHVGSAMQDFADTAAVIAQLDAVVCVDTAVAHLAGALGKPCWLLLPALRTDWRWMHDTAVTPWYPHMRLVRQTTSENWTAPVETIRAALASEAGC